MDLIFAICALILFGAPVGLLGAAFVDRAPGFGPWRGDPWPVGVQEEDMEQGWGHANDSAVKPTTAAAAEGPTMDDLPPGSVLDGDLPVVTRLHPSVRLDA